MSKDNTPEVWLLIPRYDGNGRRYHTLVHIFVTEIKYLRDFNIYSHENEMMLMEFVQRNISYLHEKQEIEVTETDLMRFMAKRLIDTKEMMELIRTEGVLQ